MLKLLLASLLISPSSQLSCYYYRIRADEPLSDANTIARNCSSSINWCVRIIHKSELAETTHVDTYVEGRCAYSKEECSKPHTCFAEAPKKTGEFSVTDNKCCSQEDLSNDTPMINTLIILTFTLLQFQHLLE